MLLSAITNWDAKERKTSSGGAEIRHRVICNIGFVV
jgi:hypothetical protein